MLEQRHRGGAAQNVVDKDARHDQPDVVDVRRRAQPDRDHNISAALHAHPHQQDPHRHIDF